jgi:hypothetical protein
MKRDNRDGPALLGEMHDPRLLPANKFGDLSGSGVAVLDTRSWDEYRHAHLPGALFTPLNSQFNTIAGCYVREKSPIVLLVEESRLREAITDLLHVGLDQVQGYITPDIFREYAARGKTATIAQIEPDEMEKERRQRRVPSRCAAQCRAHRKRFCSGRTQHRAHAPARARGRDSAHAARRHSLLVGLALALCRGTSRPHGLQGDKRHGRI